MNNLTFNHRIAILVGVFIVAVGGLLLVAGLDVRGRDDVNGLDRFLAGLLVDLAIRKSLRVGRLWLRRIVAWCCLGIRGWGGPVGFR